MGECDTSDRYLLTTVRGGDQVSCWAYYDPQFPKGITGRLSYNDALDQWSNQDNSIQFSGNNLDEVLATKSISIVKKEVLIPSHEGQTKGSKRSILDCYAPVYNTATGALHEHIAQDEPVGYLRFWVDLSRVDQVVDKEGALLKSLLDQQTTIAQNASQMAQKSADDTLGRGIALMIIIALVALSLTLLLVNHYSSQLTRRIFEMNRSLKESQEQLMEAAHQAGMAEMATGVLHNIGNILTGVSVSTATLQENFFSGTVNQARRMQTLLEQHVDNLQEFISTDERGAKVPHFFILFSKALQEEYHEYQNTITKLKHGVDLIKETVQMQQDHARTGYFIQEIDLKEEIESILTLYTNSFDRGGITLKKQFNHVEPIQAQRTKLGHIISNLLKNARDAVGEIEGVREISIFLGYNSEQQPMVEVTDTGCGIPAPDLAKIFNYGYTTKSQGHGFGLHHSANAMTEMGGTLEAQSDGPGHGATFTLTFSNRPAAPGKG